MALISEYLAADSSPDASADAVAIINVGSMRISLCIPENASTCVHCVFNIVIIFLFIYISKIGHNGQSSKIAIQKQDFHKNGVEFCQQFNGASEPV